MSNWLQCVEQSMQAQVEVEEGEGPRQSWTTFHKVPPDIRRANPTHYVPMYFTFGPCHANLEVPLSPCDLFKVQIAQALTSQQSFSHLRGAIESRDSDIRTIYKEYLWELKFDIDPHALAFLLALDALTIVAGAIFHSKLGPLYSLVPAIRRDAMLLEQQLPLFILEAAIASLAIPPDREYLFQLLDPPEDTSSPEYTELHRRVVLEDHNQLPIIDDCLRAVVRFYADVCLMIRRTAKKKWKWQNPSDHEQSMLSHIYHCLLFSSLEPIADQDQAVVNKGAGNVDDCGIIPVQPLCCTAHRERDQNGPSAPPHMSTASELQHCGIHFKAGDGGFTGIKFDAATHVLTLPEIWVSDEVKPALLNLVAQEVLISSQELPVASYITMMDNLIDTEEDVKLLVDKKVIHNMLGSHKELAEMWNTLAVHLPANYTPNDAVVIRDVSEASRQCLSKCWAAFCDTYFDKKPWLFISIIAASFIFLFTFLQTTYSILTYYNGK